MGIKSYGQREIAQHRENPQECSKLFWELELMCISTTAVSLIVWTFLIIFSANYSVYYLVLTMTVLATAFDISWFWSGQEQYRFIVIRNSIIKILGIVLLFAFVRTLHCINCSNRTFRQYFNVELSPKISCKG